ncbi:MAG: hypothetical protein WKG00_40420 [Polyangiaceae bacterium]
MAALTAAVALLVTVATDEGGPWSRRVAMAAALSPIAGAVGVLAALRIAEARGEIRALSAIGGDPRRIARGAILAGALVALLGPAAAWLFAADVEALFPRPVVPRAWVADGAGGMRELAQGLALGPGGLLSLVESQGPGSAALSSGVRPGALVSTALLAVLAPLWAGLPSSPRRRILAAGVVLATMIVSFQLVAAGRAPVVVLVLPPLCLMVESALLARAVGARMA